MNITKQIIIDKAASSQGESPYMYNLRYKIGQYIMSIALGDGNYCSPRALLDDVSEYTAVEVGIIDTKKIWKPGMDSFGSKLMSLSEVEESFGDEVARHCEGYGYEEPSSSTVLPYLNWLDVENVANRIRTTVEASRKPVWNDEMCEPF